MITVGAYLRNSTDEGESDPDAKSVQRQLKLAKECAERKGWRSASPPEAEGSAQELAGQRLPHHRRELQALGVHALVVTVEHHRVLGVRDAQRL